MKDTTHSAKHRRMTALDLDGTHVPDGTDDLPDTTREVVADVLAAGLDVIVTTLRSLVADLPIATPLSLSGSWIVASNGSVTARVDQPAPGGYRIETWNGLACGNAGGHGFRTSPADRVQFRRRPGPPVATSHSCRARSVRGRDNSRRQLRPDRGRDSGGLSRSNGRGRVPAEPHS